MVVDGFNALHLSFNSIFFQLLKLIENCDWIVNQTALVYLLYLSPCYYTWRLCLERTLRCISCSVKCCCRVYVCSLFTVHCHFCPLQCHSVHLPHLQCPPLVTVSHYNVQCPATGPGLLITDLSPGYWQERERVAGRSMRSSVQQN